MTPGMIETYCMAHADNRALAESCEGVSKGDDLRIDGEYVPKLKGKNKEHHFLYSEASGWL